MRKFSLAIEGRGGEIVLGLGAGLVSCLSPMSLAEPARTVRTWALGDSALAIWFGNASGKDQAEVAMDLSGRCKGRKQKLHGTLVADVRQTQ